MTASPTPAPDLRVHHFDTTEEAYTQTQCSDDIRDGDVLVIGPEKVVGFLREAWPVALTVRHGELHTLNIPVGQLHDGKYASSALLATEQARELGVALRDDHAPDVKPTVREIGDMIQVSAEAAAHVSGDPDAENPLWKAALDRMTHAHVFLRKHHPAWAEATKVSEPASAKGHAPRHADHPDVLAALPVLDGLRAAPLTNEHDMGDHSDTDLPVHGYAIEPRGRGLIAAYWLHRGLARRRDDHPDGPLLESVHARFVAAGWAVEPLRPNSVCVFAHRPQPTG
ncbi:hypothetical protein [Streptomyces sp. DH8]|uniref:hypothetical protein n=1 Tax=Streptomyces sp. DH8 TaxID=2857008 RepID=UPI001E51706A|nr:hypothetical protein [Streptomyces sp. DH8]